MVHFCMQILVVILCLLISLQMKVDGKNLLSVCKLAFKICRNKENDFIVQNDTLLGMYSFLSVS